MSKSVSRRLSKLERANEMDKPEVKTLDVILNPLTATGLQYIFAEGISDATASTPVPRNYDLTRGFIQGLQNTGGNIDGNYCKLTSIDLKVLIQNTSLGAVVPVRKVRFMIVRVPAGTTLNPDDIQTQVLEYGTPTTYGQLVNCSPLKRNSDINGGYDVMLDKLITLNDVAINPNKSTSYIHYRKKWTKGLTLRFSGSGAGLSLEQNRIYLFAMDAENPFGAGLTPQGATISFISRIRYSDE